MTRYERNNSKASILNLIKKVKLKSTAESRPNEAEKTQSEDPQKALIQPQIFGI